MGPGDNDAQALLTALAACASEQVELQAKIPKSEDSSTMSRKKNLGTIPELLSCLRGPWALVYWQVRRTASNASTF